MTGSFLQTALAAAAFCFLLGGGATAAAAGPNIIILADDMGYSDPGCYGGEMATLSIDRLAKEGVRLTRFENGGTCVVSRASMLTGNYWARMRKEFPKTPLLPEIFHESGYRTALIQGNPWKRKAPLFFQMSDNRAIRTCEFTMACVDGGAWELFDTAVDPLKTDDLASKKPELGADVDTRWMKWWHAQTGGTGYKPDATEGEGGYEPQGDSGSGKSYKPSAIPAGLANRYPGRAEALKTLFHFQ